MKYTSVILAGGYSRRFGKDKTLAEIHGKGLTDFLVDTLYDVSHEVFVVCKDKQKFNISERYILIKDIYDAQSPLVGIITAMKCASKKHLFIISADSPFLKVDVVEKLSKYTKKHDIVLPYINGKIYTLCGFYKRKLLPILDNYYKKGMYKLVDIFSGMDVKYLDETVFMDVDPGLHSFININTVEDFEYAKKIFEKNNLQV